VDVSACLTGWVAGDPAGGGYCQRVRKPNPTMIIRKPAMSPQLAWNSGHVAIISLMGGR
jgi:hypothetical protein